MIPSGIKKELKLSYYETEEGTIHDGVALKIQKIIIEWLETDTSITAKKLHVNIVTAWEINQAKPAEERAKKYYFDWKLIPPIKKVS